MRKSTMVLALSLAGGWGQAAVAADTQYAFITFATSVAGAMQSGAPSAAATYPRSLAATCFTCHGTDGRSVNGVPPSLAGRNKDDLLKQLQDFRDGKRPATIMHQHAKGYTNEQLELIAGYFAAVPPGRAAPAPAVR